MGGCGVYICHAVFEVSCGGAVEGREVEVSDKKIIWQLLQVGEIWDWGEGRGGEERVGEEHTVSSMGDLHYNKVMCWTATL